MQIRRYSLAVLVLAVMMLSGCTSTSGLQNGRYLAQLPRPLTDVKVVYINGELHFDQSLGHARAGRANLLSSYLNNYTFAPGNYAYTHSEIDRAKQTIALEKYELNKVDGKVLRLVPGLLQQYGLKGEATSFVTAHRFTEVADAASDAAKARAESVEYWLVIYPTGASASSFATQTAFHATLSNIVEKRAYWQGDYVASGAPVDEAQVQAMLTAFIQSMVKSP